MRKRTIRRTGILALLLCLLLLSCGGAATGTETGTGVTGDVTGTEGTGTEEGLILTENGRSSYRIVYREGASGNEMRAVNALRDRLRQGGAAVETRDDFLPTGETADAGTREILIGETNRAATGAVLRTLGEREFCARAVGNALVVVGKTEALTVRAAEKLTALLTPDGTGCIRFTPDMAFLDTAPDALCVSFLGDSITTYAGYSDSGSVNATLPQNPTWYGKSKMDVSQTWWYRVTGEMRWELCVNNSYSGGRVSNAYSYETRAKNLHTADGQQPDVILIYYGINDYNNMVPLATFRTAYSAMLDAIRTAYPEATVYCATLIPILCTDNGRNTSLTQNGAGIALTEFNRVIGTLAGAKNANVIDFAAAIGAEQYRYTYDNIHPNAEGMKRMSEAALEILREDFADPEQK